ncbi:uncharacterized protein LOC121873240 isoform X2 [Homarus americanus]|uniref:uncharacterized protein LOC121873240 isoform X2 n=1 Tax=Homarus americanus TaxID=6706 RepID=UPI001C459932|nr:uncharacterized protein LOC121873240 isoform X2 [Homarus americanus]
MWRTILLMVVGVAVVGATPISRKLGSSDQVKVTYVDSTPVCSVDGILYERGEFIPTADPCEECQCTPPGFACKRIDCLFNPGCRAIQQADECCPEYQCDDNEDIYATLPETGTGQYTSNNESQGTAQPAVTPTATKYPVKDGGEETIKSASKGTSSIITITPTNEEEPTTTPRVEANEAAEEVQTTTLRVEANEAAEEVQTTTLRVEANEAAEEVQTTTLKVEANEAAEEVQTTTLRVEANEVAEEVQTTTLRVEANEAAEEVQTTTLRVEANEAAEEVQTTTLRVEANEAAEEVQTTTPRVEANEAETTIKDVSTGQENKIFTEAPIIHEAAQADEGTITSSDTVEHAEAGEVGTTEAEASETAGSVKVSINGEAFQDLTNNEKLSQAEDEKKEVEDKYVDDPTISVDSAGGEAVLSTVDDSDSPPKNKTGTITEDIKDEVPAVVVRAPTDGAPPRGTNTTEGGEVDGEAYEAYSSGNTKLHQSLADRVARFIHSFI